jgi:hypothetical protein
MMKEKLTVAAIALLFLLFSAFAPAPVAAEQCVHGYVVSDAPGGQMPIGGAFAQIKGLGAFGYRQQRAWNSTSSQGFYQLCVDQLNPGDNVEITQTGFEPGEINDLSAPDGDLHTKILKGSLVQVSLITWSTANGEFSSDFVVSGSERLPRFENRVVIDWRTQGPGQRQDYSEVPGHANRMLRQGDNVDLSTTVQASSRTRIGDFLCRFVTVRPRHAGIDVLDQFADTMSFCVPWGSSSPTARPLMIGGEDAWITFRQNPVEFVRRREVAERGEAAMRADAAR